MKHSRFKYPLLISALTAISTPLLANPVQLDPLQVTVTTPLRMAQPLAESLAATTVITRADIERLQPDSVAQLLRGTAGVEFASNGGAGSQTSIFLRGTNSDHTLVLIDGIKVNNPTDGRPSWQFLPVNQIERIEIVRGPQSSAWGANALGGVVNIITRRPVKAGTEGEVRIGAGQHNTQLTDANFSVASNNTRFNSSLSYQKSDGFNATQADATGEKDGLEHYSLRLQVEHDINERNTLSTEYLRSQGTNEYDNPCDTSPPPDFECISNHAFKQKFTLDLLRFAWTHQLNEYWSINNNISRISENREEFREGSDNGKFDSYRDSLNLSITYNSHALSVTSGFDGNRERVRDARTGFGPTTSRTTRDSHGIYSQVFWQVSERTGIQLGGRFDHDQLFGDQATGNIGISYDINDSNTIGATYSEGYRAPSLNNLYGFGGNTDLKAEESKNYELFWRHQPDTSFQAEIRLFQNDIDDLIVSEQNFPWTQYNLEQARIRGAEISSSYFINNWKINGALTVQDPINRQDDSLLLRRAREHGRIDVDYAVSRWGAGATIEGQSKRYDFGGARMGGYALLNTRAHWHLSPDWTLRAKIDNLFDKDYEQAIGYNTPGRYFETSLTYRF